MATEKVNIDEEASYSDDEYWDEVDASPVFTVINKADIPDKFVVQSGRTTREKSSNYHTVSSSWGEALSPGSQHSLALVTLEGSTLTKSFALKIVKNLSVKLPNQVVALRWRARQLLLSFDSYEAYGNFGNRFLEGKLEPGEDHKIVSIEPAILGALPKVSILVTTNRSDDLHASLSQSVVTFWATVAHLRIVSDDQAPDPLPEALLPHLGFIMLFDGRNQRNAETSMERLNSAPWKSLTLEPEVKSILGPGTTFYQNTLGGPVVGVKTGCPSSGLQITIFVQNKEKFGQMASFYGDILGSDSALISEDKGRVCYRVYPLGRRSELMVAYFPGFSVCTSPEIELIVKVTNLKQMAKYGQPVDGTRLTDPEGNYIVPIINQEGD